MLAALPCKIGDAVYTVEYNSSDCDNCPNQQDIDPRYGVCAKKVNNNSGLICTHKIYIAQHECDEFEIHFNDDKPCIIAAWRECDFENSWIESLLGIDDKQYFTMKTAEQALFKQAEIMCVTVKHGD